LFNLTYLVEPKPGLSNARNKDTAAASGRIVAFIDDDARACPSWAKELLHAHAAFDGRAGIVGGPPDCPRWIDEKPAWIDEPSRSYLGVIDLGRELRELSARGWLAGCDISFDVVSLIAAGGFSTRLGRMGSGSMLLSNEEIEASERVRAIGKLAIYTPKAVIEHVIPPKRLTQSWFCRRAAWQAVSDLLSKSELAPTSLQSRRNAYRKRATKAPYFALDGSSERQQEIGDVDIEMRYEGISSVVYGRTSDTMKPYRSRSFLDWILAGCDDSLFDPLATRSRIGCKQVV
jgi:glycosyltransferase involved in cell wall biosynthesis